MESAAPTYGPGWSERGLRLLLPLVAAGGIGLGLLVGFTSVPLPPCPFKAIAHLPCPGCGITRSVVALMHGNLALSFRFHPLGPVLLAGAVACMALPLVPIDAYRRLASRMPRQQVLASSALAIIFTIWLVRLGFVLAGSRFFLW